MTDSTGNRLDAYEIESSHERADVLQDLAEFQLAAVRRPGRACGRRACCRAAIRALGW
jgi:hypothetical protein